jgi:kynureninase
MGDVSLSAVRAEFPLLETCTYLNSNSTGAFPRGMDAVLQRYAQTLRQWRDEAWEGWWGEWLGYMDAIAAFIGAPAGSVVTDTNLTTLLGRLATCFDFKPERNRVVLTDLEFPTVPFLWRGFGRYGAETVVVPTENGQVDEERLCAAIDERTLLVSLSHANFASGAMVDMARVVRRAHQVGAQVVADAYQSVGVVPLDMKALNVDFLLGGAHKWMCGSIESAFLYVRPDLLPTLRPAATGWIAGENPLTFAPAKEWAHTARRMASGTPAVLPSLLSRVGLDLLASVGMPTIRAHSLRLTRRVMERADEAGLTVVTPREDSKRAGVVALRFPGDLEVAKRLVAKGFVCSHRGALRVAPHFYNTLEEVERFMDVLVEEARKETR